MKKQFTKYPNNKVFAASNARKPTIVIPEDLCAELVNINALDTESKRDLLMRVCNYIIDNSSNRRMINDVKGVYWNVKPRYSNMDIAIRESIKLFNEFCNNWKIDYGQNTNMDVDNSEIDEISAEARSILESYLKDGWGYVDDTSFCILRSYEYDWGFLLGYIDDLVDASADLIADGYAESAESAVDGALDEFLGNKIDAIRFLEGVGRFDEFSDYFEND